MECSEGPRTAAPFPKKEGRKFFAHVCLLEHNRTCPFASQVYTPFVSSYVWWLQICLFFCDFGDPLTWRSFRSRRWIDRQFSQMIAGTSNTKARIVDRTDWLIQQFQPEPLHPRRTEPKSFLFQIYNLAALELLQEKMWKLMEQTGDWWYGQSEISRFLKVFVDRIW